MELVICAKTSCKFNEKDKCTRVSITISNFGQCLDCICPDEFDDLDDY